MWPSRRGPDGQYDENDEQQNEHVEIVIIERARHEGPSAGGLSAH
jgi:hypothetical protein